MVENSAAYFHACSSLLDKIAQVQRNFLAKLGVTQEDAFLQYNFAPTELRRNIGILGMLHKRVLGECHPSFEKLLPWYSHHFPENRVYGHTKQLYGHWLHATRHPAIFARSIFKMVDIYNNLPQYVVDADNVSLFQKRLTEIARDRCQRASASWAASFDARVGPDLEGPPAYNSDILYLD